MTLLQTSNVVGGPIGLSRTDGTDEHLEVVSASGGAISKS